MFSFVSIGRFLYSPDLRKPQQLGGGLESWRGFYQSIRPTQMGLSLNIGESSTIYIFIFVLLYQAEIFWKLSLTIICQYYILNSFFFFFFFLSIYATFTLVSDMSSMAFIEPLPVIDFVAQILGKDVLSKPLSDADRVKVWSLFDYGS